MKTVVVLEYDDATPRDLQQLISDVMKHECAPDLVHLAIDKSAETILDAAAQTRKQQ